MQFNRLIQQAIVQGASDLIITAGSPPVIRRSGELVKLEGPNWSPGDTEILLHQLLSDEQRRRFEQAGEINISYSIFGTGRFRVSGFRQRGTVGVVTRVIPSVMRSGAELGIPDAVMSFANEQGGLIIIGGPPGSGRTTTVATVVDKISQSRAAHIVTLENPVEYTLRHKLGVVHQREIGLDTDSFATGLRAAMHQSPDVIVVGHMDDEIASDVLDAASGRVLVVAVVTARGVRDAVAGMVQRFPASAQVEAARQLAAVLRGACCQQLVRRADKSGLLAAFEVLTMGSEIRRAIAEQQWSTLAKIVESGNNPGTLSMHSALLHLLATGEIDHSEFTDAEALLGAS